MLSSRFLSEWAWLKPTKFEMVFFCLLCVKLEPEFIVAEQVTPYGYKIILATPPLRKLGVSLRHREKLIKPKVRFPLDLHRKSTLVSVVTNTPRFFLDLI